MEGLIMGTKPLFISTPRGDKSQFDDFWKIKKSELKDLKKKPIKLDFRLLKYLFTNVFEWAIDKIQQYFWPAVLVIGGLCLWGGIMYSVYWFNKNECDRVHNLGYDTDFGFYGGCYVKVNGHWIPFEIHGVNVITEGK